MTIRIKREFGYYPKTDPVNFLIEKFRRLGKVELDKSKICPELAI
jgi:hypothetical protein